MNSLLLISNELNDEATAYIRRGVEHATRPVDSLTVLDESNKNLPLLLQSLCEISQTLFIAASPKGFATAGKILATLSDDDLQAKGEMLIPSKADLYDESGYLLRIGNCRINLFHAAPGVEMPRLLIRERSVRISLHLFGMEADDGALLLHGTAQNCRLRLLPRRHTGGWGILDLYADTSSDVNHFLEQAQIFFPGKITATEDILAHTVGRLQQLNKKISFAESCTGGRIASLFTRVSGSSCVFDGSMVTYANEIKSGWLGVNATSLMAFGAVSTPVVEEMAVGILEKTGADYALAVSGVAGPTGGSVEKPVGTVYIAAASRQKGVRSERLHLRGDREYIQIASAFNAIRLLLESHPELI
jgi:nicotinamide-nucleotide amidase